MIAANPPIPCNLLAVIDALAALGRAVRERQDKKAVNVQPLAGETVTAGQNPPSQEAKP
jgi:hypothetical protein